MSHRSTRPARLVFTGSRLAGERFVPYGRALLGEVIESAGFNNLDTHSITRRVGPATIKAWYSFGDAQISIDVPFSGSGDGDDVLRTVAATWYPRGFALYPVSDAGKGGWGVPLLPVGDDLFAPANLAPGLDTTRWTPGGQLGEVLLTQVPGAGYPGNKPLELTAPGIQHPVYGLRTQAVAPDPATNWQAYRIEFCDYSVQSPQPMVGDIRRDTVFKREIYRLVNEHRVGISRDPLMLPVRGTYDSAQATAECMSAVRVLGHFYAGFPPTYRTPGDRLNRDAGVTFLYPGDVYDDRNEVLNGGENALVNADGSLSVVLGVDPVGANITRVVPRGPLPPQTAMDMWLDSPGHRFNIENVLWDFGNERGLSATALRVGAKNSFYVQHFERHVAWLVAGNCQWLSAHDEVRPLSWWSYNTANLSWETWPIRMTFNSETFTSTLIAGRTFTVEVSGAHIASIVYTEHAPPSFWPLDRRTRLALSPYVYSRGRNIAIAPHGGLVLSAAVQKIAGAPTIYRLIALVHHHADQSEAPLVDGMTSALRVWYVDMPHDIDAAAMPHVVVRGVAGEEDHATWDWLELNSPYSWRGGALVDVGGDGTLLKYTSLWRFNPAGTKAICLRDFGDVADYTDEYANGAAAPPGVGLFMPAPFGVFPGGQLGTFTGGRRCKYLELDVSDIDSPSLFVSAVNAGGPAHRVMPDYAPVNTDSNTACVWLRPLAADYDAAGEPIFAFNVVVSFPGSYVHTTGVIANERHGVHFGAWDAVYGTAVAETTWYSTVVALPGEDLMATLPSVLNVRDKVFAVCGSPCMATDAGPSGWSTPADANYPTYVAHTAADIYRIATLSVECLACQQVPPEYTLRMYRQGEIIATRLVSNNDPTSGYLLHDRRLLPMCNWRWMPWTVHSALNATYAVEPSGAWAATLQYLPQADLGYTFHPGGDINSPPTCYLGMDYGGWDNKCFSGCGYPFRIGSNAALIDAALAFDRGGAMVASFAGQAELASLMQIPGANPRSLYARVL